MVRKAALVALVFLVLVPAGAAEGAPTDRCENTGGSYVPYDAPDGSVRVVVYIEGSPTQFTWCFFQGESLLMMRYDGLQQEDTGEPYVYEFTYPAGAYAVGFQSGAGAVTAGGVEAVDLAACKTLKAEIVVRLTNPDPMTLGADSSSSCVNETSLPAQQTTPPLRPSFTAENVDPPVWQSNVGFSSAPAAPLVRTDDPAAAIAAGALLLFSAAALAAEKLRFGYLVLLGRTLGNRVLEHPARRALVDAIEQNPGIHASALGSLLNLRGGRLQHHLSILEVRGLVDFIPAAGFRRYFPRGSFTEEEKRMLATLRRSVARQVYEVVLGHEASARDLSMRLRVSEAQFSKVAHELESVGLLERLEAGSRARWIARVLPARVASYVL